MTVRSPFKPHFGSNASVTAAAASATATLGRGDKTLSITNTGATNIAHIRTGRAADGTVTATAADLPIPAGQTRLIEKEQDHDTVAYISATGTTLQIMSGEGGA